MPQTAETDLLDEISTPSRIGMSLGQEIWGEPWKPFPFILDMEEEILTAVTNEETQDWFIVNCPNQVGKTSYVGVLLAFWFIGMFPDKQVIFISYSDSYSNDYGGTVRDLFKRHGQRLFGLSIDPQNDAAGDWKLAGHPSGGMLSVGIGGMITGRQGHLVLIDDVLRTMVEAASTTTKDAHWTEWKGTIWGRRQPGSTYIVTMTRLAEDDLPGRMVEEERSGGGRGIEWKKLIYPGICEVPDDFDGDPGDYRDRLGRRPGEPLECRFTRKSHSVVDNWFTQARDQLNDPALFDCMVQQNPKRKDAGMFPESKWRYALLADYPSLYTQVRAWDLASTKGAGDFTTGAWVGRDAKGDIYIRRPVREQMGSGDGIEEVKRTAEQDGPAVPIVFEEERSGAGKNLVEFYRRELPGYQVYPSRADGTKEQRATPYSILQKGGHCFLPADDDEAEWVKKWVKEHAGMMGDGRRPRHDDSIDAAAHGVNYVLQHEMATIVDPNDPSLEDQFAMEEFLAALGY